MPGLLVARNALSVLGQWPAISLALIATACWLSVSFKFMQYWEPRLIVGVFGALVIVAAITG